MLSRSAAIHDDLRTAILDGRVAPGEALPSERELAREAQASRHVVREALKRLLEAGLVEISQGGRTRVADWRHSGGLALLLDLAAQEQVDPALVRDGMEMRACIGADAARRCAQRAPAGLRAEVRAHAALVAAAQDPGERNAAYERFWNVIVDGADNLAYRLSLNTLVAGQRALDLGPRAVARELGDAPAIEALAATIAAGDADDAARRARDLLERSIPATR